MKRFNKLFGNDVISFYLEKIRRYSASFEHRVASFYENNNAEKVKESVINFIERIKLDESKESHYVEPLKKMQAEAYCMQKSSDKQDKLTKGMKKIIDSLEETKLSLFLVKYSSIGKTILLVRQKINYKDGCFLFQKITQQGKSSQYQKEL